MSNPGDARLALLALAAEAMYTDPDVLEPPADPYLAASGWQLRRYIAAADTVLGAAAPHVYYGFVAERTDAAGQYAVVVRGTERFVEWVIDAEFTLVKHPRAGEVEDGFWGVYTSMALVGSTSSMPLVNDLAEFATAGSQVTVVGHSLGAALATYLAFDLATHFPRAKVSARIFASPRPGDEAFTQAVDAAIPDCRAYAYDRDLVPKVPFSFGYAHLGSLVALPADPAIRDTPLANHHAANYAWLIDHPTGAPVALLPA
jgi:hypothetical protein